jgi:uncharacterized protein (DUF983 family)
MASDLTLGKVLWRALRRRCPNCGGQPIFVDWFRMLPGCINCGLALERGEEGYQVGAYMINIGASLFLFVAGFAAALLATWPSPPWTLLTYVGAALMLAFPIFFYPFSKTLFLGFDLLIHPPFDSGDR